MNRSKFPPIVDWIEPGSRRRRSGGFGDEERQAGCAVAGIRIRACPGSSPQWVRPADGVAGFPALHGRQWHGRRWRATRMRLRLPCAGPLRKCGCFLVSWCGSTPHQPAWREAATSGRRCARSPLRPSHAIQVTAVAAHPNCLAWIDLNSPGPIKTPNPQAVTLRRKNDAAGLKCFIR